MNKILSEKNQISNKDLIDFTENKEPDIFKISDEFYKGKKFFGIKIPGKIDNTDKAIDYLGGKDLITQKV